MKNLLRKTNEKGYALLLVLFLVDAPSSAEKNDPTPFNDPAVEGEVE